MPEETITSKTELSLGRIMVVDDNPVNLRMLEMMLLKKGYEVRAFPLGQPALAAANQEPPDLILLDIMMPGIDGYEVCEQLKSTARLADIPVIFLSALESVDDKIKGFRAGGVDFIAKPFQFEEVQARVETHLKLRRALQSEHDLLERTLGGAVETVWELVHLTSPALAMRSYAIRDIVNWITKRLGIEDPWQYQLAAMLCLVGCITVPEDIVERAYCGEKLTPDEDRMFRAHPERGASLLSKIPRLEVVAEIIRGHQKPERGSGVMEASKKGAQMLHLAMLLDRRLYRGMSVRSALMELRNSGEFDALMLDALEGYSPQPTEFETRRMFIQELRPSMILQDDVFSKDGSLLILKKGTILTEIWLERLENFAKTRGAREPVAVRVSRAKLFK